MPITTKDGGAPTEPLTQHEAIMLAEHERTIERNQRGLMETVTALEYIHDHRLYREKAPTFEAYLKLWGIGRSQGYRMLDAAKTVRELSPMGDVLPVNERQARAVKESGDNAVERIEVYQEAIARSGGEVPAAETIRQVAQERRGGVNPDGSPNPFADEAEAAAELMGKFRAEHGGPEAPKLELGTKVTREPIGKGDEFFTPARFLDAAREVMGEITLDPASCALANKTVRASYIYTQKDNGLACAPWTADTLWLNPPYSATGEWVAALEASYIGGTVREAMLLVNAKTETAWFQTLWEHAVICFVKGRIAFDVPRGDTVTTEGNGMTGSVIAYFPRDDGPGVEAFYSAFHKLGQIVDVRPLG